MRQHVRPGNQGFTLVEIMIVIVIILLLTQLGSIGNFFRAREKSELEQITVQMLATIDETKTDALLGKTENSEIVRKRMATIELENISSSIRLKTGYNLDKEDNIAPANPLLNKTWPLPGLQSVFFDCDNSTPALLNGISDLIVTFKQDSIAFGTSAIPAPATFPNHIVVLLQTLQNGREIHIDSRTGLTYDRTAKPLAAGGFEVSCS